MRTLILLGLILGLVAALTLPAIALDPPKRVGFDSPKKSPVDFNHEAHVVLAGGDCKACHHLGVGNGRCDGCHGRTDKAPGYKRALHKSCRGCHTEKKVAKWKDCAFCHK
jgi:hypothetical protein